MWRKGGHCQWEAKNLDGDEGTGDEIFVGESESLFYLYPDLGNVQHRFNEFQEFSLSCEQPMGAVLITKREVCRLCKKVLSVDPNSHVVVVYHEQRGTYLATRIPKSCRVCKVYEHCGFWTQGVKKQFDEDCLKNKFLFSSEDTAFDISLLRQAANLLIVGAVPFATFAMAFNRKFRYNKAPSGGPPSGEEERRPKGPAVKRMNRYCQ